MSGIKAQSTSKTMLDGDTSPDQVTTGFVTLEEIVLTTTGTHTSFRWAQAKPSGSGARSDLSSTADASVTFTPDVEGYYTTECVVDGTTTYVLRIAVASSGNVSTIACLRLVPIHDAQVQAPVTGRTIYYSLEAAALVEKRPDNSVHAITVT